MKNLFIVLEGGDGAGKATQTELLRQALAKEGKVTTFAFPQYETTEFGKLLGESLTGKHGDFRQLSPYWAALPYMLDRASAKATLEKALKQGHVVCDRYTFSNTFQTSKLPRDQWDSFSDWLDHCEYVELGLPRADVTLYLSVPPEIAARNVAQKKQRSHLGEDNIDVHEKDIEFQRQTREAYLQVAKRPGWHVIECFKGEKMRSREEIHAAIMEIVSGGADKEYQWPKISRKQKAPDSSRS